MNVYDDTSRCEWARGCIDAYLDGELTGVDVTVLESHLEDCSECSEELESARRVLDGLRRLPEKRCPDGVTSRLYEEIDAETAPRSERRLRGWLAGLRPGVFRPALVGSLIVIVATAALLIGRHQRSPRYTPAEVARAEVELKWTMAFLGDVGRRAGYAVRDDAVGAHVVEPVWRAVHSAMDGGTEVPPHNNGG